MSTNMFHVLSVLLGDEGWRDASTASEERLSAANGNLGLILHQGRRVEFVFVDAFGGSTAHMTLTEGWTCGTVQAIAHHLMIVESVRRVDRS